jgi:hypothetical protein
VADRADESRELVTVGAADNRHLDGLVGLGEELADAGAHGNADRW